MTVKSDKPSAGITVLDSSRVLAGPWRSQILAGPGAAVFKAERPGLGDGTREWCPPFHGTAEEGLQSAYFLDVNRSKHSITVDLKRPEAQKIVRGWLRSRCP